MSRSKVSTKPCLHESRPGESRGWDDDGLVEAALEGRLGLHEGSYSTRARMPALDAAAATQAMASGTTPLHVPGTEGQVPSVRLVDTSRPTALQNSALRSRLVRALGFLAIVVGTLVLAGVLKS
jgi:hypothetical protein